MSWITTCSKKDFGLRIRIQKCWLVFIEEQKQWSTRKTMESKIHNEILKTKQAKQEKKISHQACGTTIRHNQTAMLPIIVANQKAKKMISLDEIWQKMTLGSKFRVQKKKLWFEGNVRAHFSEEQFFENWTTSTFSDTIGANNLCGCG